MAEDIKSTCRYCNEPILMYDKEWFHESNDLSECEDEEGNELTTFATPIENTRPDLDKLRRGNRVFTFAELEFMESILTNSIEMFKYGEDVKAIKTEVAEVRRTLNALVERYNNIVSKTHVLTVKLKDAKAGLINRLTQEKLLELEEKPEMEIIDNGSGEQLGREG